MKLIVPIALNCLLVIAVYLADKYSPFKKTPYLAKQIIIGLLFGAVSAFASSFGVKLLGTVVNVRDAAPLTAGLVFGAPAGIIAGFIGGIYRWLSVYWGGGVSTQLACTIATIFAGFMAAGFRKLMFDDKKPTWGYGVCIAVVCEVIHMIIIFLTKMADPAKAFELVREASPPMIVGNAIAVGISIVFVSLLSREKLHRNRDHVQIAQTFQRWLLLCIVVAFLITSIFTFFLQNGMAKEETKAVFETAITDVTNDVRNKSDEAILADVRKIVHRYVSDSEITLQELADKYVVEEINVIDQDGVIVQSTIESYENFNMNSTEQSREFMVLTEGADDFVQAYGPIGIDGTTIRKYAGVSLAEGGFLQVGYNTEQFRKLLDEFVVDFTQHRHVGTGGFVAVCDENLNLVTKNEHNGNHISTIGIQPNEEIENRVSATALYEADITDGVSEQTQEYVYVFTFVEGYGIIAAMPKHEVMFMRDASIYNSVFMQVLIFATLFVFIYVLIKRVIINNLRRINQTLGQIADGNLNVTVDVRSNEEFASLSDDINSTVATLKRYISEAAARIDKELEYAKQIQLSALPTNFPSEEKYSIRANMIAAKEVGGDFYDFYPLDDHTVAFTVADVSGKGIPAAMFMMTAKTVLKELAERGLGVDEIFTIANEKLCENNESGMFVTAWMGILDLNTGVLQFANAGHNPPLLKRADGRFEYLRSRAGFVLAGMDGVRYRANELTLSAGDRLFLYTDGVTEATNTENELYGEERLQGFLDSNFALAPDGVLTALKSDIDLFVGDAPQFDDITMLLLDYKPQTGKGDACVRRFPAITEALGDVLGYVEESLSDFGCAMKTVMAVSVAIEEVFVNVAHYAYGEGEGDVGFEIRFDEKTREVTFRMSDHGTPFDPLQKPDPDITLSAEDRPIGGLGIFITKKTMDSVTYTYENGENVLTMIKKI